MEWKHALSNQCVIRTPWSCWRCSWQSCRRSLRRWATHLIGFVYRSVRVCYSDLLRNRNKYYKVPHIGGVGGGGMRCTCLALDSSTWASVPARVDCIHARAKSVAGPWRGSAAIVVWPCAQVRWQHEQPDCIHPSRSWWLDWDWCPCPDVHAAAASDAYVRLPRDVSTSPVPIDDRRSGNLHVVASHGGSPRHAHRWSWCPAHDAGDAVHLCRQQMKWIGGQSNQWKIQHSMTHWVRIQLQWELLPGLPASDALRSDSS